MPPPNLVVAPQLVVSGKLVYAPLAAPTATGAPAAQFSFCLDLANKEPLPLQLDMVLFAFTPPVKLNGLGPADRRALLGRVASLKKYVEGIERILNTR